MWSNTYKISMITAAAGRYKVGLPLFISIGGIAFGLLMTSFFVFFKSTYATFLTIAMMVPLVIAIVGDTKRFLLAILIICLPITVDIELGKTTDHIGGTSAYLLSLFEIVLAFLYLIWIGEIVQKKNSSIKFFPHISIPAFFLILMAAVSMVFAPFRSLSMLEIIEVLKMYLCFLYISNNIKTRSDVKFVVTFLLLGLFLNGVLGFAQHRYDEPFLPTALGGAHYIDSRVCGSWTSYNNFAWYLTFILPISLSLLFSEMKLVYKFLCGFTFFLGGGSLMWSSSRGGWISFGTGALFVVVCVFSKIIGKTGLIKTFGWIMIVLIFISPLYLRLFNKFDVRLGGDKESAESRLPQYEVAYNIIKNNPIVGVGINNYTEVMDDYDITEEGLKSITAYPVHNIFLHIAAEMGILGLTFFMWFISAILIEGIKCINKIKGFMAYVVIGMVAGIMGFLVHGLVDTACLGDKLYMFVWFFAGMIFAIRKIQSAEMPAREYSS